MFRYSTPYFALLLLAGCTTQNNTEVAQAPTAVVVVTATPIPVLSATPSVAPTVDASPTPKSVAPPVASNGPATNANDLAKSGDSMETFINRALDSVDAMTVPSDARKLALSMYETESAFKQAMEENNRAGKSGYAAQYAAAACNSVAAAANSKADVLEGINPEMNRQALSVQKNAARLSASLSTQNTRR